AGRDYVQAVDGAHAKVAQVETELASLDAGAAALRQAHPGISGDMGRPDIGHMKSQLKGIEGMIDSDPAKASQLADNLQQQAHALGQAIAGYDNAGKDIAAAQQALKTQG